jgi:hypothetical protein
MLARRIMILENSLSDKNILKAVLGDNTYPDEGFIISI